LALHQWPLGRELVQNFIDLMRGNIEPILPADVEEAVQSADSQAGRSARDLLHLAVMKRVRSHQIVTADQDFDSGPELDRLDPADRAAWAADLEIR
jgi:predicted nucleic acid-binding protein